MLKIFLCFILTVSMHSALASEKAFSVLIAYGFKDTDLVTTLKQYPELKDLEVGAEKFTPLPFSLKLYSQYSNEAYTFTKGETGLRVEKSLIAYEMEVKTISGDIRGTLLETISRDTHSAELAEEMSNAFSEDFSTTKGLRVGAAYEFEVEQYYDQGEFIKYGSILRASLVIGQATSRKILQLDSATYTWMLLPEDLGLVDKPFYAPVRSSRVSSLFQLNRRHPVKRTHQPHNGIDFVAMSGTPIYPALEGEIITISRTRSKGKYITILHDNGYETTYIHLKKFQRGLRVGMRVGLEDQIGEVGRTGYATGAHLHFGVIKDGFYVNPLYLLKSYTFEQKNQFEGNPDNIIDDEAPIDASSEESVE